MKNIRYTTPSGNIYVADNSVNLAAAKTKEGAIAKLEVNHSYANELPAPYKAMSGKSPMLVVGANSWLRERLPAFVLQQYDLHLVFMPCNAEEKVWKVGLVTFNRTHEVTPLYISTSHADIGIALEEVILGIVAEVTKQAETEKTPTSPKMIQWLTLWIYRCPKIALKDVLILEPYTE